ncbi:MAG: TIGR03560 family F420-dependent LLM class oxidoreductase [Acidimicrobiales bacterium]
MRFAFKTSPQHTTWDAMLAVWREADGIDVFESGWTFDHFYPIFSDPTGPCLEGWSATTALAQATTRLRCGVLVTGIPYRHPAVLANMAATVDIVSGGRLELGLGAGWNQDEADAYGIPLGTLTERFDRFDEACEVIVGLLTQETTSFAGRHFTLTDARCEPKPVQRPHPPICIGGVGPKRLLPAAARWAQHWNHPGGSVQDWQRARDDLATACEQVGRDPSTMTTSIHVWFRPDDGPDALAEECAAFAEAGVDLAIVYLPTPHTPAVLTPIADALAPLAG